jgi:hypothetical protein
MSKKIYGIPVATPFNPENLKVNDVIRHGVQNLTEAQKTQARANIGAQPVGDYALNSAIPTVPSKLPSPYALTINGVTYDGSKEVSVVLEGGTSAKRVEVLEEIALSDRVSGDGVHPEYSLYYSLELVAGETYIVIWDGAEYECVAQDASVVSSGEYAVLLGNGDSEGLASNHEPFCVEQGDDETTIKSFYEGDHTISIYKYQSTSDLGGADWNASEGEPGHVLNRTHWVEGGMVEIFPETVLDMTAGETVLPNNIGLEAGKEYTVMWNGTSYTCTAVAAEEDGIPIVAMGNLTGVVSEEEAPFFMFEVPADMVEAVGAAVGVHCWSSGMIPMAIYTDGEVVHKLDPKFLPEQLFGSTEKQIEVLPETNLQFSQFSKQKQFENLPWEEPNQGKYIVYWHGVPYECAVQYATGDLAGATYKRIVLGDVSKLKGGAFDGIEGIDMNVESGEPFVINAMFITAPGGKLTQVTVHRFHDAEYPAETIPVRIILCEKEPNKMPIKYLPDGVPYVVSGMVEFVPECQAEYNADEGMFVAPALAIPNVGDRYVVNWNGVEYSGTAMDGAEMGVPFPVLGAEPFAIIIGEEDGMTFAAIMPYDGSTELTISIQCESTKMQKIDPRCLPNGLPTLYEVTFTPNGLTPTADKTFDEVLENISKPNTIARGIMDNGGTKMIFNLSMYSDSEIYFSNATCDSSNMTVSTVIMKADGTCEYAAKIK